MDVGDAIGTFLGAGEGVAVGLAVWGLLVFTIGDAVGEIVGKGVSTVGHTICGIEATFVRSLA